MHRKSLYFIAVLPPDAIREKVEKIKFDIAREFHSSHALKSPAHITLIPPFMATPESEKKVIRLLKEITEYWKSFEVRLNGFGAFKPRVIFIDIEENRQLRSVAKELQNQIRNLHKLDIRKGDKFNPHMSVAFRDLTPNMFHQAWEKYSSASFEASFEVTGIFLLKHNGKSWDIYSEICFPAK